MLEMSPPWSSLRAHSSTLEKKEQDARTHIRLSLFFLIGTAGAGACSGASSSAVTKIGSISVGISSQAVECLLQSGTHHSHFVLQLFRACVVALSL